MKKTLFTLLLSGVITLSFTQFHTVKIPTPSPKVIETQRLGITDITVDYHSPAVRGRDIWNDVVGSYSDPNLAWRAGANMNTRISFTTDVLIEGQSLKAGSYGFHIDTQEDGSWTLMFAHHDNQWGSYYLNRDEHIALKVNVTPTSAPFSEQLDYKFIDRTENSVVIALDWGEKRIPLTVSVDLNKTVVANFRYELLGINTYRWEAWNDAASWCLNHDTNLEEALQWANRSVNGGYNGFSANKNVANMTTKARLEKKLNKAEALEATLNEIKSMSLSAYEANGLAIFLLQSNRPKDAFEITNNALKNAPGTWYLTLNLGLCQYFLGNKKAALKSLAEAEKNTPQGFKSRLAEIKEEVTNGTYKVPGT